MSFKVGDRVRVKNCEEWELNGLCGEIAMETRTGFRIRLDHQILAKQGNWYFRPDQLQPEDARVAVDPSIPLRFAGFELRISRDGEGPYLTLRFYRGADYAEPPDLSVSTEAITAEDLTRAIEWLTAVREEMGK